MTRRFSRVRIRLASILVVVLAAAALTVVAAGPASAAPVPVVCTSDGSVAGNGSTILPGHCLRSPNGRYDLVMLYTGNLVLYPATGGLACWAAGWYGYEYHAGAHAHVTITSGANSQGPYVTVSVDLTHSATNAYSEWSWSDTQWHGSGPYSVNLNNSGQVWLGWDMRAHC